MWAVLLFLMLGPRAGQTTGRAGTELYQQHKYADAIPLLEQAARAEAPGSSEYRELALMIGQSYFMLSQAPKAIPWLEKTTNVNEANYMLGYAYLLNKQQDQSSAAF